MSAFSYVTVSVLLLNLVSCDVIHSIDSSNKNASAKSSNYQTPQGYEYSGSYSTVAPEFRAQYVKPSSFQSSYDSHPSGQVSFNKNYYSAKQENYPQFQNSHDRGVILISKELQVPHTSSKVNTDSDGCEESPASNVNQDIQNDQSSSQVIKTSNYEVRRPGIRKEFYDIEEKVVIKPAGSAVFELQHDIPHSSAIVNKHFSQQQSYPQQFSDDESQYYPQQQQQQPFAYSHANHGYNPYIIQSAVPAVHTPNYNYNPVRSPARPEYVPYPPTYNPVYPSTTITPDYLPPVSEPCDDGSGHSHYPSSTPYSSSTPYPSSTPYASTTPKPPSHEFSDEHDEDEHDEGGHDYESDAVVISPQTNEVNGDNKEFVDVVYAPKKSNSDRDREDYRKQASANQKSEDYRQQTAANRDREKEDYRQREDYRQAENYRGKEDYRQLEDYQKTENYQQREDYRQQAGYKPTENYRQRENYRQQADYKPTEDYRQPVDYQQTETYRQREDYRQPADYQQTGNYRQREDYRQQAGYKPTENYRQQADYKKTEDYRQPVDYQQTETYRQREDYRQPADYQQTGNYRQREDYRQPADYQQTENYRQREDYKQITAVNQAKEDDKQQESSVYNAPEYRIDRVRNEYRNERGDLRQQKFSQYPEQFHQEYVPNVNQNQVKITPNGAPLAQYTSAKGINQEEVENSRRLIDLYSSNGDVTEIGFNGGNSKSQRYQEPDKNVPARVISVTPAPQYAEYVDERTKSQRVVLSKPLYTVQRVEVREHNHRLVEDIESDSVEPKVSEFEKLQIIGRPSTDDQSDVVDKQVEYVTPVPQEFAHLRAGSPVPGTLQK